MMFNQISRKARHYFVKAAVFIAVGFFFEDIGQFISADEGADLSGAFSAKTLYVSDGDSFKVQRADKKKFKIRMHQIDAPEKGQAWFKPSKKALMKLIAGREIMVIPVEKDQYGRIIAEVTKGGVSVDRKMISLGHAWAYTLCD